jgi:phosphoglycolate phosphatase
LITTGGAGTSSWRWAFNELYGIPADIGKATKEGMTDPVVGRLTSTSMIGHEPFLKELAKVIRTRLPVSPSSTDVWKSVRAGTTTLPSGTSDWCWRAHARAAGVVLRFRS